MENNYDPETFVERFVRLQKEAEEARKAAEEKEAKRNARNARKAERLKGQTEKDKA